MTDGTEPAQPGLLARVALSVVTGAAAGGLGRQFISHHPLLAIAIGVVVAGVTGVGLTVWSGWKEDLASAIDLAVRRRNSRFERKYREWVLTDRALWTNMLLTVGPSAPEIDQVYVDVRLDERSPGSIESGIVSAKPDYSGRRSLSDLIGGSETSVLAVVGEAGSGKTTLLRHTARQLGRERHSSSNHGRDLPILLYLKEHASTIMENPGITIPELLSVQLDLDIPEPPGWFTRKLRSGQCIVLLDGLDEVARDQDRRTVAKWAERQIRQYGGSDFVISSRPQGYEAARIEGATVFKVCDLTSVQTEHLVRNWYQADKRAYKTEKTADELLRRLNEVQALRDLTASPLLLTMIINVHLAGRPLPENRADLYSEIFKVLLERSAHSKNLATEMTGVMKEEILRGLAYGMMRERVSDLPRRVLCDKVEPSLRSLSVNVAAGQLLEDVVSNGLIVEREAERYAFAHQTFQEYLAAGHIRDQELGHELAGTVKDAWWRETTVFYTAGSDADPIVGACLAANTVPALALAFDCADQGRGISDGLRRRLDNLLTSISSPGTEPEGRRLIEGVILTRHLRDQLPVTPTTSVCARPVTNEIYRLFLEDTNTPPPDSAAGDASGTAFGMWSGDVSAFADWLNHVHGRQSRYRLPRTTELRKLAEDRRVSALQDSRFSVWTMPEGESSGTVPSLWLPEDARAPYEIDAPVLRASAAVDLRRSGSLALLRLVGYACTVAKGVGLTSNDLDFGRALNLARDLARDRARVLDFDRDRAVDLARDLARDRALALVLDRDLAVDLTRELDRPRVRPRVLGLAVDRARDRARVRALALDRDLDRPRTRPRALVLAVDLARDRAVDLARDLDGTRRIIMGQSLSRAIEDANRHREDWDGAFAAAFSRSAGIDGEDRLVVDPGTLDSILSTALAALQDVMKNMKKVTEFEFSVWPLRAAGRLSENASPIFTRAERLTQEKASAIRLAALCLAGEADARDRRDIGDMFRRVAAGITLLEQRMSGERPAAEMIMLAVE